MWHAIVNAENVTAETKAADDSYAVIKAGSYLQVGTSKLIAENGVTVCFYCYNDMHITPEEAGYPRVDMGIAFCYRYSLDGGELIAGKTLSFCNHPVEGAPEFSVSIGEGILAVIVTEEV